jgi:hypothetical protein
MRARLADVVMGVAAVGTKELRGRMRGPRAFIALTFYLALLAGFTVMIYLLSAQSAASQAAFGGGNPYASASVGQAIFTVLLFLQILLVVFLAPAATAGAISLEREKQTLDLLTATPVSTLGIVPASSPPRWPSSSCSSWRPSRSPRWSSSSAESARRTSSAAISSCS